MALRDLISRAIGRLRRKLGMSTTSLDLGLFELDAADQARLSSSASTSLAKMFYAHQGRDIHKWVHYLDIYETHFRMYRNTAVRMLEIGVSEGGSLEIWREYFGEDGVIYGIDINPECANRVTAPNQVRIGSQADPAFLRAVIRELGTPDIILDDGSHIAHHQRISFNTLFPLLRDGGVYVIEDLHTSYYPGIYEGGYRRRGTAVEFAKNMVDDMHSWYHKKDSTVPIEHAIGAVHFYDSIVVIEKRLVDRPAHVHMGRKSD